jgi:uncharacterized membrane protein YdjX (TVP38/TMEM64 family)
MIKGNRPAAKESQQKISRQGRLQKGWRTILLKLLVAVILAGVIYVVFEWWEPLSSFFGDTLDAVGFVERYGKWAPLVMIVLHATQVILAPIPGQALDLLNGYLFCPWLGTVYSMMGIMLGSALVMWLSRRFGRPLVERFVDPQTLDKLDGVTEQRGELVIFLIFLVPFLPDDAICFLAGLTNIPLPKLVLLAAVGRLPGVFVASWLGATANEFKPVHWILAGVLTVVVGVVFWRFKDRIEEGMLRLVDRVSRRDQVEDDVGEIDDE